jgi:carbon starvation protein
MVAKESHVRMIGYGGMLMESFVAISALIAASVIDPGLYFAMNSPLGVTGGDAAGAAEFVRTIGFSISPDTLTAAAKAVDEATLVSRTGGAPTLALGMSSIFTEAFGGGLAAFWYHFAIMFEALFILTAVDAGTRVGRFMLQDTIGNVWPRYADLSWKPASWSASAIVVGLWGYMLYVGVTDPLGGINQLFPLFGIANQLLAAIALALCVTLLIKHGNAKWAWVPGIGLAWDLVATMTASWQKVLSSDPKIGYFEQRSTFQAAIDKGELLAPAKDMGQMQTIVTNSTVNGVLQSVFALLVLVVVLNAVVVWVRAIRAGGLPTTEVPATPSDVVAPSDFFATKEEKAAVREWEASHTKVGAMGGGRQ